VDARRIARLLHAFSPKAAPQLVSGPDSTTAYRTSSMFETDIEEASAAALDAATIRVERTQGPVLLLAGADDGLWPRACSRGSRSTAWSPQVMPRGTRTSRSAYTTPGTRSRSWGGRRPRRLWTYFPDMGWAALGGTAKGIAAAQRAADDDATHSSIASLPERSRRRLPCARHGHVPVVKLLTYREPSHGLVYVTPSQPHTGK
jgi:hypothetical protein